MTLISIFIGFAFLMINHCLSMVIPLTTNDIIHSNITTASPTHILRVRIRAHNSLIETLVNKRQLDLIKTQLKQKQIPYRQIQDNKDGITVIIGPFHKSTNLTATITMLNQTRFHTNFTKLMTLKNQTTNLNENTNQPKHLPITVEAHEYNLAYDQESYEFRNCLESCEIYEDNELKPDHDCIRKKCLKEITGI